MQALCHCFELTRFRFSLLWLWSCVGFPDLLRHVPLKRKRFNKIPIMTCTTHTGLRGRE